MYAKFPAVASIVLGASLVSAAAIVTPHAESSADFHVTKTSGNNPHIIEGSSATCIVGQECTLTNEHDGFSLYCSKIANDLACDWSFQSFEGTVSPAMGNTVRYKGDTFVIEISALPAKAVNLRLVKKLDSDGTESSVGLPVDCVPGNKCTLIDDADGFELVCDSLADDLTCGWSFQSFAGTVAPVQGKSVHYVDATYTIST